MEKTFEPSSVEERIRDVWETSEAFKAGRSDRADAKPYCIVIPPPNVTGSLHMGHALNNTLQDVLCRFERMRGRDVLWQPGMDHAGIATQMVVERQLMERQEPDRRTMGRQAFLDRVWASPVGLVGGAEGLGAGTCAAKRGVAGAGGGGHGGGSLDVPIDIGTFSEHKRGSPPTASQKKEIKPIALRLGTEDVIPRYGPDSGAGC